MELNNRILAKYKNLLVFVPKYFEITDRDEVIAFIKRYNFGLLISQSEGKPLATHLPFNVAEKEGQLILSAHMAKANSQWKDIEGQEVLVVFSEPHAYISPSHYDKVESVPTWNYVSVHAYGACKLINEVAQGMEVLEQMIMQSEPAYKQQWDGLSEKYKADMYRGIMPFEITINSIKAAGKLSQNKTAAERQRITEALLSSQDGAARDLAGYMKGHND
jgi:transcriptional regulator